MSTPLERRLAQADRDLAWIRRQLPGALRTLASLTPDGWPTSSRLGALGGGDGLPTEDAALIGLLAREKHMRIDVLVVTAVTALDQLVAEIRSVPDLGVDTAEEAAKLRCSGGEGAWIDVMCTANSVRTMESWLQRGQRLPLCWRCLQRGRRWRLAQATTG